MEGHANCSIRNFQGNNVYYLKFYFCSNAHNCDICCKIHPATAVHLYVYAHIFATVSVRQRQLPKARCLYL